MDSIVKVDDDDLCTKCLDLPAVVHLEPCKHVVCCNRDKCFESISGNIYCPICKLPYTKAMIEDKPILVETTPARFVEYATFRLIGVLCLPLVLLIMDSTSEATNTMDRLKNITGVIFVRYSLWILGIYISNMIILFNHTTTNRLNLLLDRLNELICLLLILFFLFFMPNVPSAELADFVQAVVIQIFVDCYVIFVNRHYKLVCAGISTVYLLIVFPPSLPKLLILGVFIHPSNIPFLCINYKY